VLTPDIPSPRSIRRTEMRCSPTASRRFPTEFRTQIAKANASKAWKTRKLTWIGWETRIHGTTKRRATTMFAKECPTILPLPVELFGVDAAYSGAPPGCISRHAQPTLADRGMRSIPSRGKLSRPPFGFLALLAR
jgi:hypothetical protein